MIISGALSSNMVEGVSFFRLDTQSVSKAPDIQLMFLSFSPPADPAASEKSNLKPEVNTL